MYLYNVSFYTKNNWLFSYGLKCLRWINTDTLHYPVFINKTEQTFYLRSDNLESGILAGFRLAWRVSLPGDTVRDRKSGLTSIPVNNSIPVAPTRTATSNTGSENVSFGVDDPSGTAQSFTHRQDVCFLAPGSRNAWRMWSFSLWRHRPHWLFPHGRVCHLAFKGGTARKPRTLIMRELYYLSFNFLFILIFFYFYLTLV